MARFLGTVHGLCAEEHPSVPIFGTTGIPLACPGGSLGRLLYTGRPKIPLRASASHEINRPAAELETNRGRICGDGAQRGLLGRSVSRVRLCSKQREAPAVQDGGILRTVSVNSYVF